MLVELPRDVVTNIFLFGEGREVHTILNTNKYLYELYQEDEQMIWKHMNAPYETNMMSTFLVPVDKTFKISFYCDSESEMEIHKKIIEVKSGASDDRNMSVWRCG